MVRAGVNVDAEVAACMQDSEAFIPHTIQIVGMAFAGIVENQLVFISVILELPGGW